MLFKWIYSHLQCYNKKKGHFTFILKLTNTDILNNLYKEKIIIIKITKINGINAENLVNLWTKWQAENK